MNKSERIILVTGATGKQGGAVVRHLKQHGWKLRALTRDATKPAARDLEAMGVEVYEGEPMDPVSLRRVMAGVYGVFAVTTPFEVGTEAETTMGVNMADAAVATGVEHFVFSSVAGADRNTGVPHFESKYRVEEHIRSLDLRATVVRPMYFMDNLWIPSIRDSILQGTLSFPMKADRPLQMIAVDDIGHSVAKVFDRPEKYIGKAMDLAGDELTMAQAAGILGMALGCQVDYQALPVNAVLSQNEDYGRMVQWFNDEGYDVDLDMMRVFYSGIRSFEDYVYDSGWANEECKGPALEDERSYS